MGKVAKHGIIKGRKVSVDRLFPEAPSIELDSFSRSCLSAYGFSRFADKVISGTEFSPSEIEILLTRAPFPVLLKLTQLKASRCSEKYNLTAFPEVLLPLESWLDHGSVEDVVDNASRILKGLEFKEVRVSVDISDFSNLELWSEILSEVQYARSGLTFVAPSADYISDWLSARSGIRSKSFKTYKLERLLVQLKAAGFEQLETSSRRSLLKVIFNTGFPVSVASCVGSFSRTDLLAREMYRLNRFTAKNAIVESWEPALVIDQDSSLDVSLDLLVLRLFAVGTLCLDHIPKRRACSQYVSMDVIKLLPELGSNEFVFGAVNGETGEQLGLHPVSVLRRRVPLYGGSEDTGLWDLQK